jgi:hypothetical protein
MPAQHKEPTLILSSGISHCTLTAVSSVFMMVRLFASFINARHHYVKEGVKEHWRTDVLNSIFASNSASTEAKTYCQVVKRALLSQSLLTKSNESQAYRSTLDTQKSKY